MGLGTSSLYVTKRRRPGYEAVLYMSVFKVGHTRTVHHMVVTVERKDC